MSNLLLIALVKKFPSTFPSNIGRIKNYGPHILFFPSYFPSLLLFLLTKQVQFLISIQTSLPLFPSFHFSTLPNTLLGYVWLGGWRVGRRESIGRMESVKDGDDYNNPSSCLVRMRDR